MKKVSILIVFFVSTFAANATKNVEGRFYAPGWSTTPICAQRPDFLSEVRSDLLKSVSELPPVVLVARKAEYFAESVQNKQNVRLYGYQSFLNKNGGKVICGEAPGGLKERISLVAPTLIDNQKIVTVGQSLWRFHFLADGDRFAFWNFKKPTELVPKSLEKQLLEGGATYKMYQISHDEYELLLTKKVGPVTQYLSIHYDAYSKLK